MRINITIIIFITIITFILGLPVSAQTVSLGISPPIVELVIKPGKSILVAYRIDNDGDPVALRAVVKSFEPKDSFGKITIKDALEGPVRFSLENADLQLEQPFFIKSRSSQQLLLRIRIPDGAPEGDYYYTLLTESQPNNLTDETTQTAARASIGSNILITVSNEGGVDINGRILNFDVVPRLAFTLFGKKIQLFDSNDKIPVVLKVQNNGRNLFKPEGEISLTGNFGEKSSYDIIPQNVLGNSSRVLLASNSASLDNENNATLLLRGFFIGKYALQTTLNFGQGTANISAMTSFLALPIKLGFGMVIVILVSLFLLQRFKKDND